MNEDRDETAGNSITEDKNTGTEDEGEGRTCRKENGNMFWGTAHDNPRVQEEPIEPCRKGERSATVRHSRIQGRTLYFI